MINELVRPVLFAEDWIRTNKFEASTIHGIAQLIGARKQGAAIGYFLGCGLQVRDAARQIGLALNPTVIATNGGCNLCQIPHPIRGNDGLMRGGMLGQGARLRDFPIQIKLRIQRIHQSLVKRVDAVVIEARGDGAIDRHVFQRLIKSLTIALHLLAHIAQGIHRTRPIKLVDGDNARQIDHVDLFQLRLGAKVRGHHIKRQVCGGHDVRIGLADARRLGDDQVKARCLHGLYAFVKRRIHCTLGSARRQRAHEDAWVGCGVHADAVAEQGAAGATACRIDGDNGNTLVRKVIQKAVQQFIHQRRLARAAGAGDTDHRRDAMRLADGLGKQAIQLRNVTAEFRILDRSQQLGKLQGIMEVIIFVGRGCLARSGGSIQQVLYHGHQPHPATILGRIDAIHAVFLKQAYLGGNNDATTAAKHLYVGSAALA